MLKRKKLARTRRERERFLELTNILRDQREEKRNKIQKKPVKKNTKAANERWRQEYLEAFRGHTMVETPINSLMGTGSKKSVFDSKWKRPYIENEELAKREELAVLEAEEKGKMIAPLYNKGAYVYVGGKSKEDLLTLGKKI
jgi:hypothetical protein